MTTALYNTDFSGWALKQAWLLKNEEYTELDLNNLIEEIEAMADQQVKSTTSHLVQLVGHLLKYKYQSSRRSSSWLRTINNARIEITVLLDGNKTLENKLPECFTKAYPLARRMASTETRIDLRSFPVDCPWNIDQVMDFDWLPE